MLRLWCSAAEDAFFCQKSYLRASWRPCCCRVRKHIGALVLYIMPLILFFAGCIAGRLLWEQMLLTGGIAFIMGILLAVVYDRKVLRKKEIVYTITGYVNS